MMRNLNNSEDNKETDNQETTKIIEREINLSLINEKLNIIINILSKDTE